MRNAVQRSANSRFLVEKAMAENTAILDEPIDGPVFIIGMPRSGTTILQALLYRDSAHRSPLCWECLLPYPAPTPETYRDNPRINTIRKEFDIMFKLVPDLRMKHYMAADAPQECVGITALNFCSYQYLAQVNLPSYDRWLANGADQLQNFRWHKRFLQFLQSGGIRPVRWLLKSPLHVIRVKELFDVYPDARIVMPHREPSTFIASVASLIGSTRSLYTDHHDPIQIGQELVKTWGRISIVSSATARSSARKPASSTSTSMSSSATRCASCKRSTTGSAGNSIRKAVPAWRNSCARNERTSTASTRTLWSSSVFPRPRSTATSRNT